MSSHHARVAVTASAVPVASEGGSASTSTTSNGVRLPTSCLPHRARREVMCENTASTAWFPDAISRCSVYNSHSLCG